MPQPTSYSRQYDFTNYQTSNPSTPLPAASVDAEFNAVKTTLDGVLSNLALIQRDDGALKNGVVGVEAFSTGALNLIGITGYRVRGAWVTSTAYIVGDVVVQSGGTYVCAVAHTSGTFATDLAAVKWVLLSTPSGTNTAAYFEPTGSTPPLNGMYLAGSSAVGMAAGNALILQIKAVASANNYLTIQGSDTTVYGLSTHGNILFKAEGAATSIRMDFLCKNDTVNNYGSSGIAFYTGTNRLIMRLENTGVNYSGSLDRHVHIEPGYSGTGQFPSIRSMANDGYIGPGGSGTNNNVTTANINFGILSCGTGYIGFHTRGGNTDTAVGGGAGSGGGVDVLQAMVSDTPAANTHIQMKGGAAGDPAWIGSSSGYVSNVGLWYNTQGSGAHIFRTNAPTYSGGAVTARTQFQISHTATAVNYLSVTGSVTGNSPNIQPTGSDTDIGLIMGMKGAGSFGIYTRTTQPQLIVTDTASSVNYWTMTGSATGNSMNLGAASGSSDTNVGLIFYSKGTGTLGFYTRATAPQLIITNTASSVNYWTMSGSATGNAITLGVHGSSSDSNVDMNLAPKGTGLVVAPGYTVNGTTIPGNGIYRPAADQLGLSSRSLALLIGANPASAVNYWTMAGAVTTGSPNMQVAGTDTNIGMIFASKGTGTIGFYTGSSRPQLLVLDAASSVNYGYIKGAATGAAIEFGCYPVGDANIDIAFIPRGSGVLKFGTHSALAAETVTGYITVKDSGGTTRKLAVVS